MATLAATVLSYLVLTSSRCQAQVALRGQVLPAHRGLQTTMPYNASIDLQFAFTRCVDSAVAVNSIGARELLDMLVRATGIAHESANISDTPTCVEAPPAADTGSTNPVPSTKYSVKLTAPKRTAELGASMMNIPLKEDVQPGANVALRVLALFSSSIVTAAGDAAITAVRLTWAREREYPVVPDNAMQYALTLLKIELDGVELGLSSRATAVPSAAANAPEVAVPGQVLTGVLAVIGAAAALVVIGLVLMVRGQGGLMQQISGKMGKLMAVSKKPSAARMAAKQGGGGGGSSRALPAVGSPSSPKGSMGGGSSRSLSPTGSKGKPPLPPKSMSSRSLSTSPRAPVTKQGSAKVVPMGK